MAAWQDYIKSALVYDVEHFTIEDIESGIASGDYQLFESDNAALVTRLFRARDGSIGVEIVATGGDYAEVMDLLSEAENESREFGCSIMRFVGRPGWKTTAKARGFRLISSVYAKRL